MTSAEIANRILNFHRPQAIIDMTPLSELVDLFHDAVVEECASLVERAPRVNFKGWSDATFFAAEIRALKGCA